MTSRDALWENYNARALSPEMVAASFVAPRQFSDVAKTRNSVLLGPRGSGKTTLLRMLDPRALGTWRQRGDNRVDDIDYVGVFVPVDKAWISSLDNAIQPLPIENRGGAQLAVYTLAVARAIVDAIVWRSSDQCSAEGSPYAASLSADDERSLSEYLGKLWLPNERVFTLLHLRLLLSQHLALLPRNLISWNPERRSEYLFALASPVRLAAAACDAFNLLIGEDERRWAILCDELEIAPVEVRTHLFSALRATPPPILLKLALTPAMRMNEMNGSEHPVPANDYDSISLTYGTRDEGIDERSRADFCRGIWRGLVESHPLAARVSTDADVALVRPATSIVGGTTDERLGPMYRSLAAIDPSFAQYLIQKGVQVSDLNSTPQNLLDSVVRKVRPIVEVRSYYLRRGVSSKIGKASRKAPLPYCGAANVFAMSESHPRWLKSTLGAMLSDATARTSTVSVVSQNREIKAASTRIVARLRSFPASDGHSTYSVIEKIGIYFASQIYGETFRADPALSFIVDVEDVSVIKCLENALYIGGIVPLDTQTHAYLLTGIGGGKFRLSNWLAPHFKLPLVAGKSVNLTTILSKSTGGGPLDETAQLSLGLRV